MIQNETLATGRNQSLDIEKSPEKEPVISLDLIRLDIKACGKFLNDEYNIALKAGALSAEPLMNHLGVEGLLRISFCYINIKAEVDEFKSALANFISLTDG
jgi:cysteine desulfurase/selenocysteine lyase